MLRIFLLSIFISLGWLPFLTLSYIPNLNILVMAGACNEILLKETCLYNITKMSFDIFTDRYNRTLLLSQIILQLPQLYSIAKQRVGDHSVAIGRKLNTFDKICEWQ
jgi:hypothetical protein